MCERKQERQPAKLGAGVSEEGLPSPKGTDQQSVAVYTIEEKFLMKLPEKCWLRHCGEWFKVLPSAAAAVEVDG